MNLRLLEKVLTDHSPLLPSCVSAVLQRMGHATEIAQRIGALRHAKDLRRKEYEAGIADLDKQIAKQQALCPHLLTTFHGDPSGGSDKSNTCDICGAEVR